MDNLKRIFDVYNEVTEPGNYVMQISTLAKFLAAVKPGNNITEKTFTEAMRMYMPSVINTLLGNDHIVGFKIRPKFYPYINELSFQDGTIFKQLYHENQAYVIKFTTKHKLFKHILSRDVVRARDPKAEISKDALIKLIWGHIRTFGDESRKEIEAVLNEPKVFMFAMYQYFTNSLVEMKNGNWVIKGYIPTVDFVNGIKVDRDWKPYALNIDDAIVVDNPNAPMTNILDSVMGSDTATVAVSNVKPLADMSAVSAKPDAAVKSSSRPSMVCKPDFKQVKEVIKSTNWKDFDKMETEAGYRFFIWLGNVCNYARGCKTLSGPIMDAYRYFVMKLDNPDNKDNKTIRSIGSDRMITNISKIRGLGSRITQPPIMRYFTIVKKDLKLTDWCLPVDVEKEAIAYNADVGSFARNANKATTKVTEEKLGLVKIEPSKTQVKATPTATPASKIKDKVITKTVNKMVDMTKPISLDKNAVKRLCALAYQFKSFAKEDGSVEKFTCSNQFADELVKLVNAKRYSNLKVCCKPLSEPRILFEDRRVFGDGVHKIDDAVISFWVENDGKYTLSGFTLNIKYDTLTVSYMMEAYPYGFDAAIPSILKDLIGVITYYDD